MNMKISGDYDISVTLNTYTHLGLKDAEAEMVRMAQLENSRREQALLNGESPESVRRLRIVGG